MIQSGHWDNSRDFNLPILLQLLEERFKSLNFEEVKASLRRLLKIRMS
jgi:mannose/fructose-specific phosphotransferase system component IIA